MCSGAYVFRPTSQTATPVSAAPGGVTLSLLSGPIVSEAYQIFSPWCTQIVRLWSTATSSVQLEWTAGPLPRAATGTELISRFTVGGWQTGGLFYTDSNARELQTRKTNGRPDYNLTVEEPVADNVSNTTVVVSDQEYYSVVLVMHARIRFYIYRYDYW